MAHVYATVDEANDYLKSGGSVTFAAEAAAIKALKLAVLDSVSRRIDNVCHRSLFGSGFGPRTGTNKYDGQGIGGYFVGGAYGANTLLLDDDLQSVTSMKLYDMTAASTYHSPVVDTDYYLANAEGYTGPPWRKVILHGRGSPIVFGVGFRVTEITGVWGQSNITVTSSTTMASGFSASTTATTFTTSATPLISPGMTLLVGSEQMYLSGLSGTTATVVRGVNGTTAAVHADSSAIAYYTYDARVHDVALRLWMRRWKARDAGADGTSGGLDIPSQQTLEGEDTIIRRGLSDLMLIGTY